MKKSPNLKVKSIEQGRCGMTQQVVLPENEMERKARAIRLFSFGFLATAIVAEVAFIIVWLFDSVLPIMDLTRSTPSFFSAAFWI